MPNKRNIELTGLVTSSIGGAHGAVVHLRSTGSAPSPMLWVILCPTLHGYRHISFHQNHKYSWENIVYTCWTEMSFENLDKLFNLSHLLFPLLENEDNYIQSLFCRFIGNTVPGHSKWFILTACISIEAWDVQGRWWMVIKSKAWELACSWGPVLMDSLASERKQNKHVNKQ